MITLICLYLIVGTLVGITLAIYTEFYDLALNVVDDDDTEEIALPIPMPIIISLMPILWLPAGIATYLYHLYVLRYQ